MPLGATVPECNLDRFTLDAVRVCAVATARVKASQVCGHDHGGGAWDFQRGYGALAPAGERIGR